jgi:hypothetical protein
MRGIFEGHPFWPRMQASLLVGAKMPLEPLDEVDRLVILDEALHYGNHKSALKEPDIVMDGLRAEVSKGWQLPLPVEHLHRIPGLLVGTGRLSTTVDNE